MSTLSQFIGNVQAVEFTSSGTFVAPKDGVYFLSGCGAGGSGSGGAATTYGGAGGGGATSVIRMPVFLLAGSYTVTIPAGQTGGTATNDGADGGDLVFDGITYAKGGNKGVAGSGPTPGAEVGSDTGVTVKGGAGGSVGTGGADAGPRNGGADPGSSIGDGGGGGASAFGDGGDGVNSGAGNNGTGKGAGGSGGGVNAAGGDSTGGYLIMEWF